MEVITPLTQKRVDEYKERPIVFLAGCSPRDGSISWRGECVRHFRDKGFEGLLCVPEPFIGHYQEQVNWELYWLDKADVVLFWVPRSFDKEMYGLTTNVEFGKCVAEDKEIVFGYPQRADSVRYLDYLYERYYNRESVHSKSNLVEECLEILSNE
jgi:hypothetical protein